MIDNPSQPLQVESGLGDVVLPPVTDAEGQHDERRASPRFPYPAMQSIAPFNGVELPLSSDFRIVRCYDLSQGGVSFLWPAAPDFKQVVVMLGTQDKPVYVTANIVRSHQVEGLHNEFIVSCKFVGRLRTQ